MNMSENALRDDLVKIIGEILEKSPELIVDEVEFANLGADSMRMLELLIAIEKRFKVEIPEALLPKMINLKETMDILKSAKSKL